LETTSVFLSDEDLTQLPEEIPTVVPIEFSAELSGRIPIDGSCPDVLLSGDIPGAARIEDISVSRPMEDMLAQEHPMTGEAGNEPDDEAGNEENIESGNDENIETGTEDNIETGTDISTEAINEKPGLEQMVLTFSSSAENGMKLSELTEFIHLTDNDCDVRALLLSMMDKGMIRKYRNKYFIA